MNKENGNKNILNLRTIIQMILSAYVDNGKEMDAIPIFQTN